MHPVDLLAFGAHPDDIELTCAGTLIRLGEAGYRVGVVALSAGELGTRGSTELRRHEFEAAARIMGVSERLILGLPDGNLAAVPEQKTAVLEVIRELRPRIVLAPFWKDRHPDHVGASRLVTEAAFFAGLPKIRTQHEAHRPNRVIYYPSRYEFRPSFVVDVSRTHARKVEAVLAYRSQFHSENKAEYGSLETNISHPGFLEAVIARGKQYGSYVGVEFGEPFLVREPLRLDDPVAFFDESYLKSFV